MEQQRADYGEGSLYQKADGTWMYSLRHEGKRLTASLGKDEAAVHKKLLEVKRRFAGKIERGEVEPVTVRSFTVAELFSDYVKHLRQNGRKSADIVECVLNKVHRAREFSPRRRVATLTTLDFRAYRDREVSAGASHSTVNSHFASIRAALRLESIQTPSRVGKIPHIPTVRVENTRQGFLEYDDHVSILEALPASLKALFVIAFHSGCRLGEVLNMKWSDVDWKNEVIRLPKTKNGTQRNLPFWGSIEKHLKTQKAYRDEHHPECGSLFFWMAEDTQLAHGGVRIAPGSPIQDFRASWSNAVEQANRLNPNVPADLLFHDLRRSAVRVMIQEAGIPEAQAMLISGHKTRSMLERYNIVSLKNIQDAGAKLKTWQRAKATASKKVVPVLRKSGSQSKRRSATA
jgi:integrase